MSDTNLHGVLNMPIDIWSDEYLDKIQRHSRYVEASERIISLESKLAKALKVIGTIDDSCKMEMINNGSKTIRK